MDVNNLAHPLVEQVKKKGDALLAGLKKTKPYQLIQTYGKGLNREELESFLTRETVQTFSFYHRDAHTRSRNEPPKEIENALTVAKNLFLTFLLKLTPARRLFYAMALVLFVWGLFEVEWWWKIGGAFLILNVLLAMELADKLLTKDEMEVARAIQFSLQPDQHPGIEQRAIASHFQPASDVGGDYYDFFQAGDDRLTLILGDGQRHARGSLRHEAAGSFRAPQQDQRRPQGNARRSPFQRDRLLFYQTAKDPVMGHSDAESVRIQPRCLPGGGVKVERQVVTGSREGELLALEVQHPDDRGDKIVLPHPLGENRRSSRGYYRSDEPVG